MSFGILEDDYVIPLSWSNDVIHFVNRFSNIKPLLHLWDKLWLAIKDKKIIKVLTSFYYCFLLRDSYLNFKKVPFSTILPYKERSFFNFLNTFKNLSS